MSQDTAWLILTVILAAGSAGSFARWLLDKGSNPSNAALRVYLVMGIVFLVLALIASTIVLLP